MQLCQLWIKHESELSGNSDDEQMDGKQTCSTFFTNFCSFLGDSTKVILSYDHILATTNCWKPYIPGNLQVELLFHYIKFKLMSIK